MKPKKPIRHAVPPVPCLWPESTIVCVAGGPSLTPADVDFCRDRSRVLVVNNGYLLAPWADALYAADGPWWQAHKAAQKFAGLKFSICGDQRLPAGITVLRNTGPSGLERDPSGLRTGGHSGFQCIGLARHLGARRIVLLGYDCQRTNGQQHWHGDHVGLNKTNPAKYPIWARIYQTLVAPLAAENIIVINASRETAITAFPRMSLAQALSQDENHAAA